MAMASKVLMISMTMMLILISVWQQSGGVVVGGVVGSPVVFVVVGSALLSPWHLSGSLQGLKCMKYDPGLTYIPTLFHSRHFQESRTNHVLVSTVIPQNSMFHTEKPSTMSHIESKVVTE